MKTLKNMQGMFVKLCSEVDNDEKIIKDLQVVAFIFSCTVDSKRISLFKRDE